MQKFEKTLIDKQVPEFLFPRTSVTSSPLSLLTVFSLTPFGVREPAPPHGRPRAEPPPNRLARPRYRPNPLALAPSRARHTPRRPLLATTPRMAIAVPLPSLPLRPSLSARKPTPNSLPTPRYLPCTLAAVAQTLPASHARTRTSLAPRACHTSCAPRSCAAALRGLLLARLAPRESSAAGGADVGPRAADLHAAV